jgi:hypothetical protein
VSRAAVPNLVWPSAKGTLLVTRELDPIGSPVILMSSSTRGLLCPQARLTWIGMASRQVFGFLWARHAIDPICRYT